MKHPSIKQLVGIGLVCLVVFVSGAYVYKTKKQSINTQSGTNRVVSPVNSYADIVYLNRRPMNGWETPEKMQCGGWQIQRETRKEDGSQSVTLKQGSVVSLLVTAPVTVTDMTFDRDCEHVYWIQDRATLHAYTIKSKKKETIVIPHGIFKDHTLTIEKKTYYPSPAFLYAYGSDKDIGKPFGGSRLLVSFDTPTTGKDGSSNFSIQAIYEAKRWKLITKGGGIEPVMLDVQKAVLSFPDVKDGGVAARRHAIDLTKFEDGYVGLATPFDYRMVCLYGGDDQDPEYQACRQKELNTLFTPGHPELNAP